MPLAHAMWTHGHSLQIEYPDRIESVWRAGFFIRIVPKLNTGNWFHFAIPTPVIVDDNRLTVGSVLLRFRTGSTVACVTAVHIYDGEVKIASHDGLALAPTSWGTPRFDVPGHPEIKWGLGISIGVTIGGGTGSRNMEFASAGCDFLP
ncbi:MAG TPA: DUF6623 family protein [Pyrinomonadaceae bacterium]|nr:DUF6623 family protein [Pyrinomonadaceae bacterium]